MCGRYFLDTLPQPLADFFSVVKVPALEPSYNVAPTRLMPVVVDADGERRMGPARWGLVPFWAKDPKIGQRMINARSETVADKPAFRRSWQSRRCLVPASGFFEWQRTGNGKQPYAIRPRDHGLMAFGGIWDRWRSRDDEVLVSYAILTTRASAEVADIHDRMPVIVQPGRFEAWLRDDPESLASDLEPAPDGFLECYPVSRDVGSPRNDRPELIERIEA